MGTIQKAELTEAKREAKAQHDRIIATGPKLQRDWFAFYLDVVNFQTTMLADQPKWKLAGYSCWEEFEKKTCKLMQQSRATFYASLKTVKALPPATIEKLGKTKSFMAARLEKRGKLTPTIQEKLERADVEEAKRITRKAIGETGEGRVKLVLFPVETQYNALMEQLERIKKIFGRDKNEDALDLLISHVATMSDHEIRMELQEG